MARYGTGTGIVKGLAPPLGLSALVALATGAGIVLEKQGDAHGGIAVAATLGVLAAGWGLWLARSLRTAEALSLRDPLTELPNRVLLGDRIEQALRHSRRTGESFALIALDLDGFKEVNDVRGHRSGDEVLRRLARRLEAVVRETDTVARVGGDEFVVLSRGAHDEPETAALASRLRKALRQPFPLDGGSVEIDASIGWALFPRDGLTSEELAGCADGQMYASKRDAGDHGRRGGLDAGVVRDLEAALEQRELVVHYQPILRLSDGSVKTVEALVRRVDPRRGVVFPTEFIPHIERTALIRTVTLFVAEEALRTARTLAGRNQPLGVSVNVPYRTLDDPELVTGIEDLLTTIGVAAATLTLEVVPLGPGAGGELDRNVVARLRALGVRVALDDFGRASSLAALRVLPLDQVKIDSSFVHGLGRSAADSAVVRGLAALGHELGLEVVAPGVETRAAWDEAAGLGCDLAQGFFAAAPAPAEELVTWLETGWPAVAELAG